MMNKSITLKIGIKNFEFMLIDYNSIKKLGLDSRINNIRNIITKKKIILLNTNFDELLNEKVVDEESKIREKILSFCADIEPSMRYQLLANSIEDVVMLDISNNKLDFLNKNFNNYKIAIFPRIYFKYINDIEKITKNFIISRNWKETFIHVYDMPKKSEKKFGENEIIYEMYEYLHKKRENASPLEQALYKVIDMEKTEIPEIEVSRDMGFEAGYVVGKLHSINSISTDLKSEHLIYSNKRPKFSRVVPVDHEHDIVLLREATVEECASSIAVLYQEMNYIQWKGFKEGYGDGLGEKAADVLAMFDGEKVYFELGIYNIQKARENRRKKKFKEALRCYDDAEKIFKKLSNIDFKKSKESIIKTILIRGDTYYEMEKYEDAKQQYEIGIKELEELIQNKYLEYKLLLCSTLVNYGCTFNFIEDKEKVKEIFLYAKRISLDLINSGVGQGEQLLQIIENNIQNIQN